MAIGDRPAPGPEAKKQKPQVKFPETKEVVRLRVAIPKVDVPSYTGKDKGRIDTLVTENEAGFRFSKQVGSAENMFHIDESGQQKRHQAFRDYAFATITLSVE